jgi:spore germination cell wall hydrolase CwlJ-like protein
MHQVLAILMILASHSSYNSPKDIEPYEIYCMAQAVYHEARGEPVEGQIAVAYVVLNRMRNPVWPATACEVVYEPAQFTDIEKTIPNMKSDAWVQAVEIAALSYIGFIDNPIGDAFYYYNPKKVKHPKHCKKSKKIGKIGNHVFYTE